MITMNLKNATILPLAVVLGSCSNLYDVVAVLQDGRVAFAVAPDSRQQPECLRRVEVVAEEQSQTVWRENVSHEDACANRFPFVYGQRLRGQHPQDGLRDTSPQSLKRGIVYAISTATGSTGYGGGRFVIRANGRVENLPYSSASPTL